MYSEVIIIIILDKMPLASPQQVTLRFFLRSKFCFV